MPSPFRKIFNRRIPLNFNIRAVSILNASLITTYEPQSGESPAGHLTDPANKPTTDEKIAFVLKLAETLYRYGTPTNRLEEAIYKALARLNLKGSFVVTSTFLIATLGTGKEARADALPLDAGEENLDKLAQVDDLTDSVALGLVDVRDGTRRLAEIVAARPRYGNLVPSLCYATAAGAAARLFGGGWREILVTTIIGLLVAGLERGMGRSPNTAHVFDPVAAFVAAICAVLAANIFFPLALYIATAAGLVILFPGWSMTVAINEISTRHLIAGASRLTRAVLLFFQMGFGVALGWQLARLFPQVSFYVAPQPLPDWTLAVAVVIATLSLCFRLRVSPPDLPFVFIACMLTFIAARIGGTVLGAELGVFVGALCSGVLANIFARLMDRPATIINLPSALLLVPGSVGFGGMAKFIQRDVISGVETFFSVMLIAVALVTGLLVANVIFAPRRIL